MNIYGLDPYADPEFVALGPRVQFVGEIEPNIWAWSIRSHENLNWRYEVVLHWETGTVYCSCRHACRRLNKWHPKFTDGCKHVDDICLEAARILEERNEL